MLKIDHDIMQQWVEVTISDPKKFCASARSRTPVSHYPGEHHTTRLPRHWIAVTFTPPRRKHVLMHFCTSARSRTPASRYLGEHHTTRLTRHLIAVTLTPSKSENIKEQTKEDRRKNDKYQRKFSLPLQLSLDVNEP